MNTLILAICGTLAFPNGNVTLDRPTHVVAVQANSTVASGTLRLRNVVTCTSASDRTVCTTNVVTKGQSLEKRDAYVGTDLVYYGGSDETIWSNAWKTVTNVVDSVTNTVTFNEQTLSDSGLVRGVWTNVAASIRQRYETANVTVTNVSTRTVRTYDTHQFTNTVIDVTLSYGRFSSITNLYIPAGMMIGDGTVFTNGARCAAWIFTE